MYFYQFYMTWKECNVLKLRIGKRDDLFVLHETLKKLKVPKENIWKNDFFDLFPLVLQA